ncbi:hypothetical protein U0070_014443 [Myodes glareolus]|uniref:Uncharacterized protein n=1 Tax=Myodes glareolus TaxID=447135 RepID=A0AAW0J4V2_MYOGA
MHVLEAHVFLMKTPSTVGRKGHPST